MTRKRAPGGGRKPSGPIKGKSEALGTRIRPDTKAALIEAAREHGRSLSQEVEIRLRASLQAPDLDQLKRSWGNGAIHAFCRLLGMAFARIEHSCGRSFTDDAFTAEAFRVAFSVVLGQLAPHDEQPVLPTTLAAQKERNRDPLPELFYSPEGIGGTVARSLMAELDFLPSVKIGKVSYEQYGDAHFLLDSIRRGLSKGDAND